MATQQLSINTFNGGLIEYLEAHLLNGNQSTNLVNAELTKGALSSLPGCKFIENRTTSNNGFVFENGSFVLKDFPSDNFFILNDYTSAIFENELSQIRYKDYINNYEDFLSLVISNQTLTVSIYTRYYPLNPPSPDKLDGFIQFAIVFGNDMYNQVSEPIYATYTFTSDWFNTLGFKLRIPRAVLQEGNFTTYKVYQKASVTLSPDSLPWTENPFGQQVDFQLLSEGNIPIGDPIEIELGKPKWYYDLGEVLDPVQTVPYINTRSKNFTLYRSRLWLSIDNRLYFSELYNNINFSNYRQIRFDFTIVALAPSYMGLIVFTSDKSIYLLEGYSEVDFRVNQLNSVLGVDNSKKVITSNDVVVFVDKEDIFQFGSSMLNMSKYILDPSTVKSITSLSITDKYIWFILDDTVLVYDTLSGQPIFWYYSPEIGTIKKFIVHPSTNQNYIVTSDNKLYEVQTSDTMLSLTYKSPKFIGQTFDSECEFESIKFVYKGEFEIKTYVNEQLTNTFNVSSSSITTEKCNINEEFNKGLYIQVEVSGIGTIYNYRIIYSYTNLEN